jgi:hypothetical protein
MVSGKSMESFLAEKIADVVRYFEGEPTPDKMPAPSVFDLSSYHAVVNFMAYHMEDDAYSAEAEAFRRKAKWGLIYRKTMLSDLSALVGNGKPWDYKKPLLDRGILLEATKKDGSRFPCAPLPGDNQHLYFYDIWGNIHFGYVARKCGFWEKELLLGATIHDIGEEISWGESADDRVSIGVGFKIYDLGSANATTIHMAITDAIPEWTEGITKIKIEDLIIDNPKKSPVW